jgi:hypothetical protein
LKTARRGSATLPASLLLLAGISLGVLMPPVVAAHGKGGGSPSGGPSPGSSPSPGASQGQGGQSTASLQGDSYARLEYLGANTLESIPWEELTKLPDPKWTGFLGGNGSEWYTPDYFNTNVLCRPKRVMLCYKLVPTNSSPNQPFILQKSKLSFACDDLRFEHDREHERQCGSNREGYNWHPCATVDENHPLLMGQRLVIAIDTSAVPSDIIPTSWTANHQFNEGDQIVDDLGDLQECITPGISGPDEPTDWATDVGKDTRDGSVEWRVVNKNANSLSQRLKVLNINVTSQPATSGPAGLRPTLGGTEPAPIEAETGAADYSSRQAHWAETETGQRDRFGCFTRSATLAYYGEPVARAPLFLNWRAPLDGGVIPSISVNLIYTPPAPGLPWQPRTFYSEGSVVTNPDSNDGHFYTAISGGISGSSSSKCGPGRPKYPPSFSATPTKVCDCSYTAACSAPGSAKDPKCDPAEPQTCGIVWLDTGTAVPSSPASANSPASLGIWIPGQTYKLGDSVVDQNGHIYTAFEPSPSCTGSGAQQVCSKTSGCDRPSFPETQPVAVQDPKCGTLTWLDSGTTAPAVVAAGQQPDQLVNLLSTSLPQTHALYRYNLAAGVVVSGVRNPKPGTAATSTTPATSASGSRIVDPVLMLTWYPIALDADSMPTFQDWFIPGLSGGISMSSPTSRFYLGASIEPIRYLQLVVGENFAQITPTSGEKWTARPFLGGTVDLSSLIAAFGGLVPSSTSQ